MFSDSARYYSQHRRGAQRRMSYQEYLAGADLGPELGGQLAAADASSGVARSIAIGVATGALIFVVNRWLERLLK